MTNAVAIPVSRFSLSQSAFLGGLVAGLLDAANALVTFKLFLNLSPVQIYQFVASGVLSSRAYDGGLRTAALGLAIHFLIAFSAAAEYNFVVPLLPVLKTRYIVCGLAFGILVYVFMNYVVIPLSAIRPSPFSVVLFLNGVVGHALFVGLPIAYFAKQ